MKFSITGLLIFTVVAALCTALGLSRMQLSEIKTQLLAQQAEHKSQLEVQQAERDAERDKFQFLNITDPTNIAAVQLPYARSSRCWQWRVNTPEEGRFVVRVAYNDLQRRRYLYKLEPGESVLSVSLQMYLGKWRLCVSGDDRSRSSLVECDNTDWIASTRYGASSAGYTKTREEDSNKPFFLLSLKESDYIDEFGDMPTNLNRQADGKSVPQTKPSSKIKVWIEKYDGNKGGQKK